MASLTVLFSIILATGWCSANTIGLTSIDPDPRGIFHMQERIIGGDETTIERFPYIISIRYLGSHRCGGSLVKPNFMITAGHCVSGAITFFLRFVAGSSYRNSGGEDLYVDKIILHEGYNAVTAENDIALVRMDGFFEYKETIQPILLANTFDRFRDGTKAVVSGWGTESEGAPSIPVQLRYTYVYGFNRAECNEAYTELGGITSGMICAWYPGGGKDACQGDSGGPLVVADRLIGIVSWGLGCARADYPGVYTDVAYYRDWIEQKLVS